MGELHRLRPTNKKQRPEIHDMTSQVCIWSAAGLAPYRLCSNGFDCMSCPFDKGMQRQQRQEREARRAHGWRPDAEDQDSLASKRCRHMVSGYVPVKYCAHDFNCQDCAFDQMIEETMRAEEPDEPMVELVSGFGLAPRHYYQRGHTWARLEYGGQVRVGMDDFAARLFGPPDEWVLPQLGQALSQGMPGAEMRREGQEAGLLSPVKGIVVAVNPRLRREPDLANRSPFGQGWLAILQPVTPGRELRNLLFGRQAEEWLEEEAERLDAMLYPEAELRPAATGGRRVADIYGAVPGLNWEVLVRSFLLS